MRQQNAQHRVDRSFESGIGHEASNIDHWFLHLPSAVLAKHYTSKQRQSSDGNDYPTRTGSLDRNRLQQSVR